MKYQNSPKQSERSMVLVGTVEGDIINFIKRLLRRHDHIVVFAPSTMALERQIAFEGLGVTVRLLSPSKSGHDIRKLEKAIRRVRALNIPCRVYGCILG